MTITKSQLVFSATLWLVLPMALFFLFWLRVGIGVVLTVCLIAVCYKMLRSLDEPQRVIHIVDRRFVIAVIGVAIFTVFSGIGGFLFQDTWDHSFRNGLFEALVYNPWPVVKCSADGCHQLLCYYIGFWLPSAAVAKITGSLMVGYVCQLIYAFWGWMTVMLMLFYFLNRTRINILVMIVFALYCGWDVVLSLLFQFRDGLPYNFYIHNKDLATFIFSAPTVPVLSLFIYNQGIAAWVGLSLIYLYRKHPEVLVAVYSLLFIFAPIPCLGVLPVMVYVVLRRIKTSATVWNTIGIVFFLIISFYYISNNDAKSVGVYGFSGNLVWTLIAFVTFSYGVYLPFIWQRVRRDALFWGLFVSSIFFSVISLGDTTDLAQRVTIPFVCYMTVLVLDTCYKWRSMSRVKQCALVVVLLVGMYSSSGMYYSMVFRGRTCMHNNEEFRAPAIDPFDKDNNLFYNNFVAEGESIFTKVMLAR